MIEKLTVTFPNLVEFRVIEHRGFFRRKMFVERYVDTKLVGASWVRVRDRVLVTVTLDVEKGVTT